jgi:hypothetical protein
VQLLAEEVAAFGYGSLELCIGLLEFIHNRPQNYEIKLK